MNTATAKDIELGRRQHSAFLCIDEWRCDRCTEPFPCLTIRGLNSAESLNQVVDIVAAYEGLPLVMIRRLQKFLGFLRPLPIISSHYCATLDAS